MPTSPYAPPIGSNVGIKFTDIAINPYTPPIGSAVPLEFTPKDSGVDPEPKPTQYLFPVDIQSQQFGASQVFARFRELTAVGADSQEFGSPSLKLAYQFVGAKGFDTSAAGKAIVENWNKNVTPTGYNASLYGLPLVYNYLQYLRARGVDTSLYGKPYMQGGVKFVAPKGFATDIHGKTVLVNTTADQYAVVPSIKPQVVPAPSVSPRILYTKGFNANSFGGPVLERSPMPIGEDHSRYGHQTVWFHTRPLSPNSIESYNTGYPVVYDPTQEVQTPSLVETGIFGDTGLKNLTEVVSVFGIEPNAVPVYNYIENANRYITRLGFNSFASGANAIENKSPSIAPVGINSLDMPLGYIAYRIQTINLFGWHDPKFGKPLLEKTPELLPRGISSPALSEPFVWFKNRTIDQRTHGRNHALLGVPTTWFRYRVLSPAGGSYSALGSAVVTHGVREVIAQGYAADAQSTKAWVSYGVRFIEPLGIYKINASNHFVGRQQDIAVTGFEATRFGDRIIPESQTLYTTGFVSNFGLANLYLKTKYVLPNGFITVGQQPQDRWGRVVVYNLTQYIQQNFDVNSGLAPPEWTGWTAIENRNKAIGVTGVITQGFGYIYIYNNAAPLLPASIDSAAISSSVMVSHSVRYLKAEGIDTPYIGSWHALYNDAAVLAPKGLTAPLSGRPELINNRRYYGGIGAFDALTTGAVMVSDRVRTIDVEFRYSIGPPVIEMPKAHLQRTYVDCTGFDSAGFGDSSWSIHRNTLTPRWAHRDFMGEGFVWNVTPELKAYGRAHDEHGNTAIRLEYRNIYTHGDGAELFGRLTIADTTRAIEVKGWASLSASQKHVVIKGGVPPYVEQTINLDGYFNIEADEYVEGYGITLDVKGKPAQVGFPKINQNVIYVINNEPATLFGSSLVRSNSIIIDSGIADHNVGDSTNIGLRTRAIDLTTSRNIPIDSEAVFGNPSLSPHTIYAPIGAPAQAVRNHKRWNTHPIDGYNGKQTGIIMGRPFVENRHRVVSVYNRSEAEYKGLHSVYNKRTIVSPAGIPKPFFASPVIPFTEQSLELKQLNNHAAYGRPSLKVFNLHRALSVRGVNYNEHGRTMVSNYIREVYPNGLMSQSMGQRLTNDKPYMWQGLRVGEYVPFIIDGIDSNVFGNGFVSLRVREVEADGFNTFVSDYDPFFFNERTRVKNVDAVVASQQFVTPNGFDVSKTSFPSDVKNSQHYIKPDGNSDQFRKGGYHA